MKITLWLPGYLGPSANKVDAMSVRQKIQAKKKARFALLSALQDARRELSTSKTSIDHQKRLLMDCAMLSLLAAIARNTSTYKATRRKSVPRLKSGHVSKSIILANPHLRF